MSPWKMSNGFLIVAAGWLLSAFSVLGAVGYVTGKASGGSETPDFVLLELGTVLMFGSVLTLYGSWVLHRWYLVFFPIVTGLITFVLLFIASPSIVCGQTTCIPAGSHP